MMVATIIDYGMGNLWSVASAINYLGYEYKICSNPYDLKKSDVLILPGVGSFRRAMNQLNKHELLDEIKEAVSFKRIKILGICLGMQLLCDSSTEDGETKGLELIPSKIDIFSDNELNGNKIPHIGFNSVYSKPDSKLFNNLPPLSDFYFVHSYRMLEISDMKGKSALCNYGNLQFVAAYEHENIFATQFHPEKSQTNGLRLLKNFFNA